jgi:cell division protein ZapA
MSSNATNYLDITLLGKEYRVAYQKEEKDALLRTVAYIDGKMREISGKARGNNERIAVMVALNVTHEFLCLKNQPAQGEGTGLDFDDIKRKITLMEARLDAVLEPQDKLI